VNDRPAGSRRSRQAAAAWKIGAARLAGLGVLALAGCASGPGQGPSGPSQVPVTGALPTSAPETPRAAAVDQGPGEPRPGAAGRVLARDARQIVYLPTVGDRLGPIAERLLGDGNLAWSLAEANGLPDLHAADRAPPAGEPLLVPTTPRNTTGVTSGSMQVVTVLCYHRFGGPPSRMNVTAEAFDAQLAWLARHDYHVVRLADLQAHLEGRRALPPRAVVLTIDDGYESVHRVALPLLRRHGVPATLFVTTDFLGARDGLDPAELRALRESGLVDIQAHGKTHRSLTDRRGGEVTGRPGDWLHTELHEPIQVLSRRLPGAVIEHLAYPYGNADRTVVRAAADAGYTLGLTVSAGGNPFFAHPLLLRRTMIYGDQDLAAFRARLQSERPWPNP
jgi:peptidoglycan/xylan/chitin deacetylase (PgdA/CDA1 family)